MPRSCSICEHPNRNAIEADLDSGTSLRNVAQHHNASASALFRHKEQHIKKPANGNGHTSPHIPEVVEPEEEPQELCPRHKLFVSAYIGELSGGKMFNGTEAARQAGYEGSDNALGVQAHKLLRMPKIKAAIDEHLAALQVHMTGNEVLAELAMIARAEWRDFVEIKMGRDGETVSASLRLGDKLKALELIGKYYALFTDKVIEQRVTVVLQEKAQGAYRRLREELGATSGLGDDELAGFTARILDVPLEMVTTPAQLVSGRVS